MKTLQLTKFYPPVFGGIETATYELAEGLVSRGHPTDVLCANTERPTVRDRFGPVAVTRAGSYAKLLSTSMAPALITELAKVRKQYEIVHVHLPNPMANVALQLARPSAKVVLHWHSDIISQTRALKLYEPLQASMLRRADAIIATSPPYADASPWLDAYRDKVHVVPLGIHPQRLRQPADALIAARAALRRRTGERPIIFSIGRMATYKGFDILIEAARLLDPETLVLVGGGGELLSAHQRKVQELGLAKRVIFTGRLSDLDVAAHMAEACVFCLPSTNRAEAFGMVLLEAMLAGLPIVATQITGSGVPWVNTHGETGLNVAASDPQELAAALRQLVADPTLARRMGAAGRQRFESRFTADRMVEETIEVYRHVLSA
ncbi:glycosyltransferase [Roseateles cellulosilyticus]|uniref:Glycosyltransferase n=1 Tax=Pelomonas cellulosilytica TaxID=2906762 RepID=A0ABS8XZL4_9BURK|nr:glycosyltransferase [Pelomonas sp. P8]MCE4558047.1 glycosyltransferase [Pelomonas sp. P8]